MVPQESSWGRLVGQADWASADGARWAWDRPAGARQRRAGAPRGPGGDLEGVASPHQAARRRGSGGGLTQGAGVTCPRPLRQHPCLGPFTSSGSVSAASQPRPALPSSRGAFQGPRSLICHQSSWKRLSWHYGDTPLARLTLLMPPSWVSTQEELLCQLSCP